MVIKQFYRLFLATTLSLIGISSVQAQHSPYVYHEGNSQVGFEWLKPLYVDDLGSDLLSSVWFISGSYRFNERIVVVADVPFAYFSFENNFSDQPEFAIGNPYIGLELSTPGSNGYGEFGVRLPFATSDAFFVFSQSTTIDFDRADAFIDDFVPVTVKGGYVARYPNQLYTHVKGGVTALLLTERGRSSEVFLDLAMLVGYDNAMVRVAGGVTSRFLATQDRFTLEERTISHAVVHASVDLYAARPGVIVRFPLDSDVRDVFRFVGGFTLVVGLN